MVQTALQENPFSGHVFVFRGRRGDLIKMLWWTKAFTVTVVPIDSSELVPRTVRPSASAIAYDAHCEAVLDPRFHT